MGTRGLWNLHFAGKWYRRHHPRSHIPSPHGPGPGLARQVQAIIASLDNLQEWELVPFPSPSQSDLDYVYTIDVDSGTLTITRWETVEGLPQPFPRQIQLSRLNESERFVLDSLDRATVEISEPEDEKEATLAGTVNQFDIQPGAPTPLNELQFRLFCNFCFVWRSFIDDPSTWQTHSAGFHTFAIGLLRIAAWDLEVSSDTQIDYPDNGVIFPRWESPETDVFWFHGYLVVLHRTIDTEVSISAAISKAQSFLNVNKHTDIHSIILSFQHVVFVELSSEVFVPIAKMESCARSLFLGGSFIQAGGIMVQAVKFWWRVSLKSSDYGSRSPLIFALNCGYWGPSRP
ncbi:hypothetical protein FQN50_000930 [Emmonsiellopsis sp. PD_5]|nr:hypothetical protein FQN50_000930 [Emmonsiellopsis sp. PD_5]